MNFREYSFYLISGNPEHDLILEAIEGLSDDAVSELFMRTLREHWAKQ